MGIKQLIVLSPVFIISTIIIVLIFSTICTKKLLVFSLFTEIGLILAVVSIGLMWSQGKQDIFQLLCVDNITVLYIFMILITSLISSMLAEKWLPNILNKKSEFYILLLISNIGSILLITANHLVIFFLGMELISLPLFGLIGVSFFQNKGFSLESGIKYAVLSGVSSSFLLLGIALIYADTGFLSFIDLNTVFSQQLYSLFDHIMLIVGIGMVIVGCGFKLSFFPFHWWFPDINQGAPYPVSMYLITGTKIAVFPVFIRFVTIFSKQFSEIFYIFFSVVTCCSILFGNLMAIQQKSMRRVLSYSSITNIGYLLIGLISLSLNTTATSITSYFVALESLGVYLVHYFIVMSGIFGVISIVSGIFSNKNADSIIIYRGLFWNHPILSVIFTILILSLSGMPMTFGFIAKFYLLMLGISDQLWCPVIVMVIGSVIGMFLYFKIVINLYVHPDVHCNSSNSNSIANFVVSSNWILTPVGILVISITCLILFFGLYPQFIIDYVRTTSFV